jgi:hypothetical protein
MRNSTKVGLIVPLLLGTASLAVAGERIPIKGTYTAINKSQVIEVGPNHMIVAINAEGLGYALEGAGAGTPMQHSAGPCLGAIEIKDGTATGRGYCFRKSPQGAKWVVTWVANADLSKGLTGTFEIRGVDGPATGWKGAGTWGPSVDTTPTTYINTFAGYLEKP